MPLATVLVPTRDHGPTLHHALRSARRQSVEDLEILVVGDGVPDGTRRIVAAHAAEDRRVRFHDRPKGPRHGEIHRHEALAAATGRIVCYLSDDDLWLPDHVASLLDALERADFACASGMLAWPDGSTTVGPMDLARENWRRWLLEGRASVPLSFAAHTLALYRRLPHGWRTTPDGVRTDRYMWRQILEMEGVRAATSLRPTVLQFPSPHRGGMTPADRVAELAGWERRIEEPGGIARIEALFRETLHRRCLDMEERIGLIEESPSWRMRDRVLRAMGAAGLRRRAGGAPGSRGAP